MDVATFPLESGRLNKLPPELVGRILDQADPADHLNFALACKRLAACSQHALRRHRDAYAKYRLCSDISPETVPTLLRLVMRDPIVAWHVRSFEVWGARRSWASWEQFRYMLPRRLYPVNEEDRTWHYDGDDEPPVEDTENDEREFDISIWGDRVDRHFKRGELEGLQALRDVAIGVECGLGQGLFQPPILTTSLYHLPGIKTLYLHGGDHLGSTDPGDEDVVNNVFAQGIFALTPGCSSLEHVFFDECRLEKDGAYHCFLAAPRSLVTFAARRGLVHDRKQWVSSAAKYQSKTLEAMMFYKTGDDRGSYCAELGKDVKNLRCFDLQMGRVEEAMKDPNYPGSDMRLAVAFLVQWLRDELPRGAEVITFSSCDRRGREPNWNVIQLFDVVFASLLESGKPENLKAVYFGRSIQHSDRRCYLPNSFDAGLRYGVNIYIQGSDFGTANVLSHEVSEEHEPCFPRPRDKFDLITGPFFPAGRVVERYRRDLRRYAVTQSDGGHAFDPLRGEWVNNGNWDFDQ
ncbi:hypothetical protein CMUS01_02939 [Colletotrichum musicola]|uniref:F-box domain-containing protein n=1 Tax=Colletotrichum musicola TaxID=2175873 RepID=A0A8H6U6N9_9PEZI|nr:hypothetical protein CMUS01_02939 [Colletotrichum musicola]